MYNFRNDYSSGAHPTVLQKLIDINLDKNPGYGLDEHCKRAADLIERRLGKSVDVHFIAGGTLANLLSAAAFLKPYESIIAVETSHIFDNETGAVEATGHKIIPVKGIAGKLIPDRIVEVMKAYRSESKTLPKLVYITDATELGTVYTKGELIELRKVCDQYDLLLYLDGARLAQALTSDHSDIDLSDIAQLTDAFFIGGTKNGTLLGEALIIVNESLKRGFRYMYKQRGAMLAKGFVMGTQFEALFEGDLYYELGRHANEMANRLAGGLTAAGVEFYIPQQSNQIFVILDEGQLSELSGDFSFETMTFPDGKSVTRFVTSWTTCAEDVDALISFFG